MPIAYIRVSITYIRVSSEDQSVEKQRDLLKDSDIDHFYTEKFSGLVRKPKFTKNSAQQLHVFRLVDEVYTIRKAAESTGMSHQILINSLNKRHTL